MIDMAQDRRAAQGHIGCDARAWRRQQKIVHANRNGRPVASPGDGNAGDSKATATIDAARDDDSQMRVERRCGLSSLNFMRAAHA
jgi:hypothetical protein